MSFGEDEPEDEYKYARDAREREESAKKESEMKKQIGKKSKKELIQIAFETHLLRKPHNSIPVNVKSFEVLYSLTEKCFFARIELDSNNDTVYLIECNKAYDLPLHY